jgi:hypothetical protein
MKKISLVLIFSCILGLITVCEAKRSRYRNYKSGGQIKLQKGYVRKSTGKYVNPHIKTNPDNSKYNNLNYNK